MKQLPEYGIMLQTGGYRMVSRLKDTLNRQIKGVRGIVGEYYMARFRSLEKHGDRVANLFNDFTGLGCQIITAPPRRSPR